MSIILKPISFTDHGDYYATTTKTIYGYVQETYSLLSYGPNWFSFRELRKENERTVTSFEQITEAKAEEFLKLIQS